MLLFFYRPNHHEIKDLNANRFMAVTFHCILPKPLWEWDEMSCMYMRFEGYSLGNWKHNIGDFKVKRCVSCLLQGLSLVTESSLWPRDLLESSHCFTTGFAGERALCA